MTPRKIYIVVRKDGTPADFGLDRQRCHFDKNVMMNEVRKCNDSSHYSYKPYRLIEFLEMPDDSP